MQVSPVLPGVSMEVFAVDGSVSSPRSWLDDRRVAVVIVGALVAVLLGATPGAVLALFGSDDRPAGCVEPNRSVTLYAEELDPWPDGSPRLGYGLEPGAATTPGPLLEMVEGECLAVTLVNDVPAATLQQLRDDPRTGSGDPNLPLGVSLHVHGVKYMPSSDGTVETDSFVPPGESRTSLWYAAPRTVRGSHLTSQGTAGTWWYHDHIVGTSHGTAGMEAGLVGGLVVRKATDPRPDRTYTVVFGDDNTINFRRFPDTMTCDPDDPQPSNTCFVAEEGEDVEFVVIGIGDEFHTFHLHGHSWAANRTGLLQGVDDQTPLIDNRTLGPGDSFSARVVAGELVGPGMWMLHCHVQEHADAGMATDLLVLPRGGGPVEGLLEGLGSHAGHAGHAGHGGQG